MAQSPRLAAQTSELMCNAAGERGALCLNQGLCVDNGPAAAAERYTCRCPYGVVG